MNKIQKLRGKMKEASLEAIIIFDELNQRYLSDFAFTDGFLLVTMSRAYLCTDFRYYEMAIKSASHDFEVLTPTDRWAFINSALSEEGCHTLGFEGDFVSYYLHKTLGDKLPGA